ncbi:hypothetical protein TNCV_4207791 [Trichonephila clavipes]|nr:hypothetical protein TNCV_4207791 [Trichonephila clavipes]
MRSTLGKGETGEPVPFLPSSVRFWSGTGTERKLEFSGANAEGFYTQWEKKRKSIMKMNKKIHNSSEGGGMNETPATYTERAGRQPRNRLATKWLE